MVITLVAAVLLVLCMVALGVYASAGGMAGRRVKTLFGLNLGVFFGLLAVTTVVLLAGPQAASASEAEAAETAAALAAAGEAAGLAYVGAALSTGLATIGAGIAVAFTGSAALGAISEDQTLLGKTLIFVGLAEGIAIYGLIISILILGKV